MSHVGELSPDWSQFQRDVAHLFRTAGFIVVENILVEFKKVDVLVSEHRLGKPHRIAIECKAWNRKLTQQDVAQIYANYLPLIPEHVDEILIVTRGGVADSAVALVLKSQHLRHLTYVELHANIMDFRLYLNRLAEQFSDDGLNRYYVPLRSRNGDDLEKLIDDWMTDVTRRPIAILGSYGLGKTTFARKLAHKFANKAIGDSTQRIPILVRLGDIANEQSLEGLLGKLFTATSQVKSYNFSTFVELNRAGRFFIIFDGFDEMKQTLSWSDFRYNFHEINRVISPNSKVLILGRPTAFLNDAEHAYALHGMKKVGNFEFREPDWPDYEEVEVAPFAKPQIEAFLPSYLKYLIDIATTEAERNRLKKFINYDAQELLNARIGDIVKRPVQLKMITEILPDYHGKLSELTVHGLYDYFIGYVIERESFKQARRRFTTQQRRNFARDIALWLWSSKERGVSEQGIPQQIMQSYMTAGEDRESVARDLVSACLLDRRVGGQLFFPHRSFQEFLVAQGIRDSVIERNLPIGDVGRLLNPEVVEFLEGFADREFINALCKQLSVFRGTLPISLLNLLSRSKFQYEMLEGPWLAVVRAFGISSGASADSKFVEFIGDAMSQTRDVRSAFAYLFAALIACRKSKKTQMRHSARSIGVAIDGIRRIVELELADRRRSGRSREPLGIAPFVDALKSLNSKKRKADITINLNGLYKHIHDNIRSFCGVSDWERDGALRYAEAELPENVPEWKTDAFAVLQVTIQRAERELGTRERR